jgi:adenylosuccinate synthase
MNDFDEIKMCTAYEIDGKITDQLPFEFNTVEIKPQYVSFKGWKQSLAGITKYEELPRNLRDYISAIEQVTGVSVRAVSISPDRKDVIFKK